MRTLVLAVVALVLLTGASSPTAPLRIAAIEAKSGSCAAPDGGAAAGEKAYYDHLAKRLGVTVLKCPVADRTAAAKALAAGELDMAVLDPASFAPVAATTRSILTIRPEGGLNRVPVVLAVKASSPAKTLGDLRGKSLAFGGSTPAAQALPETVLAQRGVGTDAFKQLLEPDAEAAVEAVLSGKADAVILHAAAWQRLCVPDDPKIKPPCAGLRIVMRARPEAAMAIVVRKDILDETRYRLIGIHMPMHLENKAAFVWASSWTPKAAEFVPTEALALTASR